ncbi:Transcriptional regulatory protein SIN3 [Spathaspora sp. JA1]|nr:Transcriptional regulatory protein SIN3 [Spathaspora sp. JA1]
MTNQPDPWNTQQRPLVQQFNRPPVLPPPATLEQGKYSLYKPIDPNSPSTSIEGTNFSLGGQPFYPLPSLPSLGNGSGHPQHGHQFTIPSINPSSEPAQLTQPPDHTRQTTELRRPSNVALNPPTGQLPPTASEAHSQSAVPPPPAPPALGGIPNRSTTSNVYRPLNVKDALSYLDQVKIQFYNQADVYNNFLDIMKDFKSQSIDTPGVIDRVSTLFQGHPNLIQGFNTFLPPGYKIECSLDPSDPNPIKVTTPTGTTTRPNIAGNTYNQRWGNEEGAAQVQQQQVTPQVQYQQEQQNLQGQPGGSNVEFNHAISYVNKIKTRFANQPDTYKQFLEILQTYQREQKPISEVYEQVTVLFANSPDLLDDFKQFLPDTGNQGFPQQQPQPVHIPEGSSYYVNNGSQLPPVGNFQPPTGTTGLSPSATQQQYGQQISYPSTGSPEPQVGYGMQDPKLAKKRKSIGEPYYEDNYNQEARLSGIRSGVVATKTGKPGGVVKVVSTSVAAPVNPTLVPGIPEPIPPYASVKTSSLSEEISFFDKVKKAIGNKQSYSDFLKILNLFTQDIIDKDTLVERVQGYIGETHPDLFNWFKMFVGYKDTPQNIENITFKKHQLELSLCKAYGPSYRQLPKAETYMPCSGRDEMCWEVLNDEWVGHPTWASEDSGFIAHRKNQYEEILFKIEEERLEFDYYMESNLRTIQILETIANRIANMTPEQKVAFKLPPGLGHNSTTIYKKVIRKIYGKDRGFEVIDALHENPAIAVPIVLKRLKQKDEEWKRAQREWNKVWREMEQKVFYKSLDHLGLTFKQADKKLLTAKQLVSEISTVKVEQQNKRLHPLMPKPQEQLNYSFEDTEILFDIVKLADVFIHRSSNYSAADGEKLSQFLQFFVSLFFGIPSEDIQKALTARSKNEKGELAQEETENSDSAANLSDSGAKKRIREGDLLRDVLKKQSKSKKEDRADSPTPQSADASVAQEVAEELEKSTELWIKSANTKFSLRDDENSEKKREKYNIFCNTTIYVYFRHLTTLYERLQNIKSMNEAVGKEIRSRKHPQFAKDLNLLSHQLEGMGVEIIGSKDCYAQVLDLSERLIEGEIEHQWFEEGLRQAYRNKAYKIYTIDKVVQALVKHMYSMITDTKTSEMIVLFENDRLKPVSSAKEQILYRIQVRALMSADENMFKISFNETKNSASIQFVSLDDLTINDHESSQEQYNYYVTSFVLSHPTEGVPASNLNMPFSRSFIESVDEDTVEGRSTAGLKVSICENSYRLFFEENSHDEFIANSVYKEQTEETDKTEERIEKLKKLLNGEFGWKSALSENEDASNLEEKIKILYEKGAAEFKEHEQAKDEEMKDADTKQREEENEKENPVAEEVSADDGTETKPESTEIKSETHEVQDDEEKSSEMQVDADTTVAQPNDTTIQADANDTTADETINPEETTIGQDD